MIKKERFFLSIILLFLNGVLPVFSQINNTDSLQNQFIHYQLNHFQEKIYVHTDKDFYLPKEHCWFKIYLVDAFFNKPSPISKIAYFELLDPKNQVVFQTKISINDGFGEGSFQVPTNLNTGTYIIKAYTNWMKNFDSEFYFSKSLKILNPHDYKFPVVEKKQNQFDIQFFPEGGSLVNGLESKVAFKITDEYGLSKNAKGLIINNFGDTLVKFSTLKFGRGTFKLIPKMGESYLAQIIVNSISKIEKALPNALNYGMVMALANNNKNQIDIKIDASTQFEGQTVQLMVHSKGVFRGIFNKTINNKVAHFLINNEILKDGISQFTLFDQNQKPIAERIYFKKPENITELEIKTDRENYGLRDKVNISIKNRADKKIVNSLSVAVYLVDSLQKPSEIDIKNYLLLTSDLKDTVEAPSYYFNANEPDLKQVTENLMLTNDWIRFDWPSIMAKTNDSLKYMPEVAGHIFQAKIVNNISGKPIKNAQAYLTIPGERLQFYQSKSDENGILSFEMKSFYNSNEIIIQADLKDSTYTIEFLSPFSKQKAIETVFNQSQEPQNLKLIYDHNKFLQVESAYSNNKLYNSPKIDTTTFYNKPDETYLLDNFTRFTTLEEVLREYVLSVGVKLRNNNYQLEVFNKLGDGFFEEQPLLLLDGLPIFDINKFMKIDPLKLKKLEVISMKYYLGDVEFNGIVNFTSYKGDLADYGLEKNSAVFDYEGIQISRQFYSPQYDTKAKIDSRLPDFRQLLYWNPLIKINENIEIKPTFFTSDIQGKYAVEVQGLASDGSLISTTSYFNVIGNKK